MNPSYAEGVSRTGVTTKAALLVERFSTEAEGSAPAPSSTGQPKTASAAELVAVEGVRGNSTAVS